MKTSYKIFTVGCFLTSLIFVSLAAYCSQMSLSDKFLSEAAVLCLAGVAVGFVGVNT